MKHRWNTEDVCTECGVSRSVLYERTRHPAGEIDHGLEDSCPGTLVAHKKSKTSIAALSTKVSKLHPRKCDLLIVTVGTKTCTPSQEDLFAVRNRMELLTVGRSQHYAIIVPYGIRITGLPKKEVLRLLKESQTEVKKKSS